MTRKIPSYLLAVETKYDSPAILGDTIRVPYFKGLQIEEADYILTRKEELLEGVKINHFTRRVAKKGRI